ncbi:hypothetical protein [Amycolatopsis tucumanensis]|uniref:hypothetical protein n=1 Tax=Amycolatopsis tucumanensis TaxID=401106 RepID=UPI001F17ECAA|nr:hypothetical protein [Amycolatopsis tucumanensis]MCF6422669.1 hypothetical protein [Amycolatopsis tucumanensis]
MAHEMVTVCLPSDAHRDLRAALDEAMSPFADGEWDHWWLGRSGDVFDVLPGHGNDPRLVRAAVDARGEPREWTPGTCDGGPRGLLDFAGMRTRAARRALEPDPWIPFARRVPDRAVATENLLSLNGSWICHDDQVPVAGTGYFEYANSYLDDLAPEAMVVRLRIHC